MRKTASSLRVLLVLACVACTSAPEHEAGHGALHAAADPWASDPDADAAVGAVADGTYDVRLTELLVELVSLSHLNVRPEPAYVGGMTSSHNPISDGAPSDTPEWFANQDFVALAADEVSTLLELEGPGVITRVWAASPKGRVRFYLDGDSNPIIDAPFDELLDGAVAPFEHPFASITAYGRNLYFPIPFAKGCRITLTGPTEGTYFHISYRRYAASTRVESLSAESLSATAPMQQAVADKLGALRPDMTGSDMGTSHAFELAAGTDHAEAELHAPEEGARIWELRISAPADELALRTTALVLTFDDEETVRVPLGDFFAYVPGSGAVNSLASGVTSRGVMTSRWPMPFQHTARIRVESLAELGESFLVEAIVAPAVWNDDSLHFHATWTKPETFPSSPPRDWSLARIEGEGLYVGTVLNVINRNAQWWGEGDEKIYVDGESFPSYFGTGTEDYFGYGWCSNETFSAPYNGQPLASAVESFGRSSLYRLHISDPIPFTQSLRFDLEVRHWGAPVDVTYDATAFWYARPGAVSGARVELTAFELPEIDASAPAGIAAGSYRCGG